MIKEKYTITDFLPLITVFVCILILTTIAGIQTNADLPRLMQLFMGIFFLIFGTFKLWNLKDFAQAYRMYDLIAMKSKIYGYTYPFLEFILGLLYILGTHLLLANIATLILMTVSAIGVFIKLRKKEKILCACLGTVFTIPMTWVTLTEDLLMAAMAAIMLLTTL